jgi:hypothetical protein
MRIESTFITSGEFIHRRIVNRRYAPIGFLDLKLKRVDHLPPMREVEVPSRPSATILSAITSLLSGKMAVDMLRAAGSASGPDHTGNSGLADLAFASGPFMGRISS